MNWVWAALICVGFGGLEALAAGKNPVGTLRSIRQPRWSPPFWLWAIIGAAWYAICFVGLARLLPREDLGGLPVLMLLALMAANGAWGILQFRMRRFDLALGFAIPYALLLAAFLYVSWPMDRVVFTLFAGYAAYLPYAGAWMWRIWRLNPRPA